MRKLIKNKEKPYSRVPRLSDTPSAKGSQREICEQAHGTKGKLIYASSKGVPRLSDTRYSANRDMQAAKRD